MSHIGDEILDLCNTIKIADKLALNWKTGFHSFQINESVDLILVPENE